jgi:hypothetical protein
MLELYFARAPPNLKGASLPLEFDALPQGRLNSLSMEREWTKRTNKIH